MFIYCYGETVTQIPCLVVVTTVFKRKGKIIELIGHDSDTEDGKMVWKGEI